MYCNIHIVDFLKKFLRMIFLTFDQVLADDNWQSDDARQDDI
jgi:hypothetical protein